MQPMLKLSADTRTITGKQVNKLRGQGKLPAILYGRNVKSTPLVLDKKAFLKVFSQSGENTLIQLAVGAGQPKTVLVHDVQHHFLSDDLTHVDFYEVKMTEKIKAKVPVVFVGEAKAVKDLGGVLVKNLNEVEVESLPGDLPHEFTVDVSKLTDFEAAITVAELSVDASKVKVLAKPEEVVAKVTPPRTDEELKALEEKPVEEVAAVEGIVKEEPAEQAAEQAETEK